MYQMLPNESRTPAARSWYGLSAGCYRLTAARLGAGPGNPS